MIVRRSLTPVSGPVLVLGPTKTHQERRVDLGPFGLAALRQQSTQQAAQRRRREGVYSDRDLVFANALGRPLQVSTVHRWVKAAFERPGLPFSASVRLSRGSLRAIPNSLGSTRLPVGRPIWGKRDPRKPTTPFFFDASDRGLPQRSTTP